MPRKTALLLAALAAALAACVTTPETGRRALILISEAQEQKLGSDAYAEILATEKESTDARKRAIVERVGKRIASVTPHPEWAWEFKVIDSQQANAFCLPGGKVAFYTGIFPYLANEAGLATVMGHEVAHAIARHGGQRVSQGIVVQLGVEAASVVLGPGSTLHDPILAALGLGLNVGVLLPFSRTHELEADEIGLYYMARAGYDYTEGAAFWERFSKANEGGKPPELLSTHPSDERRIAQMQALQDRAAEEAKKATEHHGKGEKL